MAIRPEISLGVQPPQINPINIPSPYQALQQRLTLQGLMESRELRQLQIEEQRMQIEQARQQADLAAQFRTRAAQLKPGEQLPAGEVYKYLGAGPGGEYLSREQQRQTSEAQEQIAQNNLQISRLNQLRLLAGASTDAESLRRNLDLGLSYKLITPEQYQQWISAPFNAENIKSFARSALTEVERLQLKNAEFAQKSAEETQPIDLASKKLDLAEKQKTDNASRLSAAMTQGPAVFAAELAKLPEDQQKPFLGAKTPQEVLARAETATQRITREHNRLMESRLDATARETARHNRAMEVRAAQTIVAGLTAAQSDRVLRIAGQFDNEPMVKNYNIIAEANNFVRSLGEKRAASAGDDQALLYSFAKAMDPGSVVREGEYATVQKYSQSWAQQFGFKVERIFLNSPFLSDDARKQMKDTIAKRASSAETSYKNIYNEYGRRIERQSGVANGKDYLTNYGQAFEAGPEPRVVPQAQGGLTVGQIVPRNGKNFRYRGGDPTVKENWAEVK